MALRKMTFTVPEEIAAKLRKRVPVRNRSSYVAAAIADKLNESDQSLIRACEAANEDRDVLATEQEMDALTDEITEPWSDTHTR